MLRRPRTDEDFAAEIAAHLALEADDLESEGHTTEEAARRARATFHNPSMARENFRMRNRIRTVDDLLRDLRFGLRQLSRSPGFAATAILTLALGLGANTAVFSLINGLLLRALPVPHAEELAVVKIDRSDSTNGSNFGFCSPFLKALEHHHEALESVAGYTDHVLQVRGAAGMTEVHGTLVSGQFFNAMEVRPLLGRYLTPDDDRAGSPSGYPVVIGESFWKSWFNRAPNIVGTKLVLSGTPFTVVGVMPREFYGADPTSRPSLYLPMSTEPIVDAPYNNIAGGFHTWWFHMIGRRRPGVSMEQANASLQALSDGVLSEAVPDADWVKDARANHFHFAVESGSKGFNYLRTEFRKPLLVVFGLCGAMLLLACLNLASLLMARAAARERELSTRLALGASRRRLIQQLLVESLLISVMGTVAGLAVTPLVSHALSTLLLGRDRFSVIDTSLDLPVFAFAAAIAVVASLVTGLVPALRATSGDLNEQIKSGSQTHSTRERRMLPRVLMGSEVALALTLVIGAGLLAASLTRLYRTGLGFVPQGLANIELQMSKQSLEGEALVRWYQSYGEALSHLPGVKGVSFQKYAPLTGASWTNTLKSSAVQQEQGIHMNAVAPDYFATMRIPLFEGRDFGWQDTKAADKKIVLNRAAAKLLFPNEDAVGKFVGDNEKNRMEVIAVVGDVTYESIRRAAPAAGYVPLAQDLDKKDSYSALVRIDGPAAPLAVAARELATRMAPEIPAPVLTTMSSTLDASISSERMMAMLSTFFAACALLVTAIGLYGTLAYTTARRTSEIGIRIALGSKRLQVVLLVFRENLWSTALGCAAGLGIAVLASKALSSFLYGTSTRDPWVMAASVGALALIASAASLLPAVRAARTDPMQALRTE